MGFCHENQGLSALCVAWSRAPRALDGEMPGTKGPPLLDPTPAPCLRLEDCKSCLPRAAVAPRQGGAYPVKVHC